MPTGSKEDVPPVLYLAAMSGDLETWELFYFMGCDGHHKRWGTPLGAAIQGRNPEIYGFYLYDDAFEVNSLLSPKHGTALQAACLYNLPDLVDDLIERGADPGGKYDIPLQAAAYRGNFEVVEALLAAAVDIDMMEPGGHYRSALCAAASKGHLGVMKLLIEGTDPADAASRAGGAMAPVMDDREGMERLMHAIDSIEQDKIPGDDEDDNRDNWNSDDELDDAGDDDDSKDDELNADDKDRKPGVDGKVKELGNDGMEVNDKCGEASKDSGLSDPGELNQSDDVHEIAMKMRHLVGAAKRQAARRPPKKRRSSVMAAWNSSLAVPDVIAGPPSRSPVRPVGTGERQMEIRGPPKRPSRLELEELGDEENEGNDFEDDDNELEDDETDRMMMDTDDYRY
ncbi:hypothetical protein PVAG01_06860 [Phlyctema vagabunda]|uniref:Ankyrin repeat protein n=1 Tax=Phlyctema vagabunda TaxID=108571 RepID=A0ABR4PH95_9HELO